MIREYLLDPHKFWPETHKRNAIKIDKFLFNGCGRRSKSSIANYIECLVHLGEMRSRFNKKHLYLVNAGSSGSHWLEAMLGLLPGFHNGGEIYLPKGIIDYLSGLSASQADIALDIIYLAHSGNIYEDSLSCSLSNSAHLAKHDRISRYSEGKSVVLLLRNPIDVVLSRTFRKEEYRRDIAPSSKDREYLERNCVYMENFYKGLDFDSFDLVVKYEEFMDSPKEKLRDVADLLDLVVGDADLDNAVFKTSKSEEVSAIEKGDKPLTNFYIGNKRDHEWARNYIQERLGYMVKELGYS